MKGYPAEGQITSEECYNALKDFKVVKTPGTDGFPAEYIASSGLKSIKK